MLAAAIGRLGEVRARRTACLLGGLLVCLTLAPDIAQGATTAFGRIPCKATEGVQFCEGSAPVAAPAGCPSTPAPCQEIYDPTVPDTRVPSWDGTPLDANVTLPLHENGNLPLVILIHGFTSVKTGLTDNADSGTLRGSREWALRGYAVLSYSARGQGDSCGTPASRVGQPACATGWQHLMDVRYESHDTQYLAGLLVDQGIVDRKRIGVTGFSWGGGSTAALAALRNRTVLPNGEFVPWVSPRRHLPMTIAAAAANAAWTDIPLAAASNGTALDYTVAPPDLDTRALGVTKLTFLNGLLAELEAQSYMPPPGFDPPVASWVADLDAGWPVHSNENPQFVTANAGVSTYHGAFFLPYDIAPAPTLFSNGWNDDIFPVTEGFVWRNRVLARHPKAHISMFMSDVGHQRSQNKGADVDLLRQAIVNWFDHYLRGRRSHVVRGIEALTTSCPSTSGSRGPYRASSWARIHPGEVRYKSAPAQTLTSQSGSASANAQFDPIAGPGVCASAAADTVPSTATYHFAVRPRGFTLLGSATVIANLNPSASADAPDPFVAAHLYDVSPDGKTETLVARQTYRPTHAGRQVFQLYPQGWRFAPGHTVKLELAGQDAPYSKPDAYAGRIVVKKLELRLPTAEKPNCRQILRPAAPVVPSGETLAAGVDAHPPRRCRRAARGRR